MYDPVPVGVSLPPRILACQRPASRPIPDVPRFGELHTEEGLVLHQAFQTGTPAKRYYVHLEVLCVSQFPNPASRVVCVGGT